MRSETELSNDIGDLPDSKDRNLIKDSCLIVILTWLFMIMLIVGICYGDRIDKFFQEVYKFLTL